MDSFLRSQPAISPAEAGLVVSESLPIRGELIYPQVRAVLQGQHYQVVILLLAGIHDARKVAQAAHAVWFTWVCVM